MAAYQNPVSPGHHTPRSPSWQDPRDVTGWPIPGTYEHQQTAPMSGWQSPPVPVYHSPAGSGQLGNTSPGYTSPPPGAYHDPNAQGYQSPPPGRHQDEHVAGHQSPSYVAYQAPPPPPGHHHMQQPVQQVPVLAAHPVPPAPAPAPGHQNQHPNQDSNQHPSPSILHRHSTTPAFQIWSTPEYDAPLATGHTPPFIAGQASPPAVELPEQRSPATTTVPPEPTQQRRGFSLSSVLPRRSSDHNIPQPQQQPPQFRRDTVSGNSVTTRSTPTPTVAPNTYVTTTRAPYVAGKTSAWYKGANYSVEEIWNAVQYNDEPLVRKCLKAGLSVDYCKWNKQDKTFTGMRRLEIGLGARTLADLAASNNALKSMRVLMEYGVDLSGGSGASFFATLGRHMSMSYTTPEDRQIVAKDPWTTPIHRAAKFGHVEMLQLLLTEGRVDPNVRDAKQRTALHMCVIGKDSDCAKLLLDRGVALELGDVNDMTPLTAAAFAGKLELVELFADRGAVLDADDKDGETALYLAALGEHYNVVRTLVKRGAEINFRNNKGWSAFFRAASTLNVNNMKIMANLSADVDFRDRNGCTALLRATMARNIVLINHLLHIGADIDIGDDDGWTPLFAAMIHNDESLISLLLASGADISKADVYGNTALHHAALLGSTPIVRHILATQLHHKDSHKQVNVLGETPTILAAKHNHHAVLKLLLKYGADPQYVDANGFRALDRAMYWGSHASIRLLSSNGVAIDSQAFVALQQGKIDNPGAGLHEIISQRLQPQQPNYSVSRKPTNPSSSNLRDLFARTVTPETLIKRMREKQGKPVEDPPPAKAETKPTTTGSITAQNKPATTTASVKPGTISTTTTAAKVEEEEEYVSPDPFEACIPKLPASMMVNNLNLSLKAGGAVTAAAVAGTVGSVANVALGIAGLF